MAKMTNLERARQFMPFAALRGFEEMIRQQTKEVTPRRELSEEDAARLSKRILQIEKYRQYIVFQPHVPRGTGFENSS